MISSFQNNLVVSRLPITKRKDRMRETGKWYLIYGDDNLMAIVNAC